MGKTHGAYRTMPAGRTSAPPACSPNLGYVWLGNCAYNVSHYILAATLLTQVFVIILYSIYNKLSSKTLSYNILLSVNTITAVPAGALFS